MNNKIGHDTNDIIPGTYTNYCSICGERIYSYDDYCKDCFRDVSRAHPRNKRKKIKGDKGEEK